jgi:hypothetical protein
MAGWEQKGNGIVAGDDEGTQERALEIRRQLKGVIPDAKLQIYTNDENHELAPMGGNACGVLIWEMRASNPSFQRTVYGGR